MWDKDSKEFVDRIAELAEACPSVMKDKDQLSIPMHTIYKVLSGPFAA